MDQVDLLVFGPHPDDIEIGMGGTVAAHVAGGHRVGLCDLTRGEMGSNGTPEERVAEASAAAVVLGVRWRHNLGLPDRAIGTAADHARAVADIVRRVRPRTVALPHGRDRHPDHVAGSRLVADGVFNAGLRRYPAAGEAWRPDWICFYFINDTDTASFVVDVSSVYERKREALACYRSQFFPPDPDAVQTRLTTPRFLRLIESRDAQLGARIDVSQAEGFVASDLVARPHLFRQHGGPRTSEAFS